MAQAQTPDPAATPAATPVTTPVVATSGGFGEKGQIVISGDLQLDIRHISNSAVGGGASSSSTQILVQPSLDYFVAPNISVGGSLSIGHLAAGGTGTGSVTVIGIAVRGGYNLNINEMLSFWPQLQLGYNHLSFESGVAGAASVTGSTMTLAIFAPVLYHVTQHLFIGVGPIFQTELSSKVMDADQSKQTDIGITSVVGGYFGG